MSEHQPHQFLREYARHNVIAHKISVGTSKARFADKPIVLACSCGTAGDFSSISEAGQYAMRHASRRGSCKIEVADELKGAWTREVGELN